MGSDLGLIFEPLLTNLDYGTSSLAVKEDSGYAAVLHHGSEVCTSRSLEFASLCILWIAGDRIGGC
jgi:hypothetical protein